MVAVKVHAVFLQPLGKRAIFEASEGGEHGNLQPNVVETNVSQSVGSKASLALGLFVCERVVFITAGPIIKLCAGGEGDREGHVLETGGDFGARGS